MTPCFSRCALAVAVLIVPCAPFAPLVSHVSSSTKPWRRPSTATAALKGDSTITVFHRFERVVVDPRLAADGNFWVYCNVVADQGGFALDVLADAADPTWSARELLVWGGADAEDAAACEGGIFRPEAVACTAPPTGEVALLVTDETLAATPKEALRAFGAVIAVGGQTMSVESEAAGIISVSSMGELRALTICSYASLNKRA